MPNIVSDSLNSNQFLTLIDVISEGEIEGLKDGEKSIYLDNVQLQNPDDTYNFQNVAVETRTGKDETEQEAIVIGDSSAIETPYSVGIEVKKDFPVVRLITDSDVDAVRVTIDIPQLQNVTEEGDVLGYDIRLAIDVQYTGGVYTEVVNNLISGRTGDLYQRDYEIALSPGVGESFPAQIKVRRISDDNTNPRIVNAFKWSSYSEIIKAKLRYPHTALVGIRVDASQFSNAPERAYLIRGIKIKIPHNATVDTSNGALIYDTSTIFNGTFKADRKWCSDPAWILWDLLTSKRYGFGDHIAENQLDVFSFYAASKYCSEIVNGEPRFSCNVNIQTQEEAYKLINDMCSVFRAMPYWNAGTLSISQDAPDDWAYLFTLANVGPEGFKYESSSRKARPTVVGVSYLDLNTRDIAYEFAEDADEIKKYGVVKKEVSAFACTSQAQARRVGEWVLYSEKYEGETVTFTTSIDAGVMVRPGQLIKIADPVKSSARRGGRIVSATTTTVTVDDATGLTTADSPQLNVILSDGTVEQRSVSGISGNEITVSSAFSSAPNANSIWLYGTTGNQTTTWRVLGIAEQDQANYTITALAYEGSKYGHVERGLELNVRDISDLNVLAETPTNLTGIEYLYDDGGIAKAKILFSWSPVAGVSQYQVQWRFSSDNWKTSFVGTNELELFDTSIGTYEVKVYSLNASLLRSAAAAELLFETQGKSAAPETPTGLSLVPNSEATAILSWDRAVALDVLLGGKVLIRHSKALSGATWDAAQTVIAAAAGSQTQKQVPLLEGTYLIKFEDDTGNRSATPAVVIADLPTPQDRLLVEEHFEDTNYLVRIDDMGTWDSLGSIDTVTDAFPGTSTNMTYDSGLDALRLTDPTLLTGEYVFKDTVDLGGVFDVNLRRNLVTYGYLPNDLWDSQTSLIDTWTDIDGDSVDQVDALMYVRTTKDNPGGTPTWGAWNEMTNALIRGRGLQFKIIATTENVAQNIAISELGYVMEMQQRIERSALQNTPGTGAYTVTFAQPFYEEPALGVTAYTQFASDLLEITEVTRTGFKLEFKQDGVTVSRSFTYTAVGYGKEIIV
jgi:predicted phage tail protein